MREALAQAQLAASENEIPVGAIIVDEQQIIGWGWNKSIKKLDPTAHAEVVAIRDACQSKKNYRLPNTTLYVTIEPCTMCLGAIMHARIQRVVFAATEPKAGVLASHPQVLDAGYFNHKIEWSGGVLETEANTLMRNFFQQRRASKKHKP